MRTLGSGVEARFPSLSRGRASFPPESSRGRSAGSLSRVSDWHSSLRWIRDVRILAQQFWIFLQAFAAFVLICFLFAREVWTSQSSGETWLYSWKPLWKADTGSTLFCLAVTSILRQRLLHKMTTASRLRVQYFHFNPLSLPRSKSTFSQPFKGEHISEVVRIGVLGSSFIWVNYEKPSSLYCVM